MSQGDIFSTSSQRLQMAGTLLVVICVRPRWWEAAGDRDQALVDLKAEQGVSANLRSSIAEQNVPVDGVAG